MKNPITFTFHKSAGLLAALAGLALSHIPANSFAEKGEWEQASVVEIEEFLEEHLPEFSNWLQDLKHESWHEYAEGLEHAADLMTEISELRERNEELARMLLKQHRLGHIIKVLAEEWHAEENRKKKNGIKQELRDTLADSFGLEQDMLPVEIEELEAEIGRLKQELEERAENREEIIDEAVEEILSDKEEEDDEDEEEEEEEEEDDEDE